jgi:hypothetical protein
MFSFCMPALLLWSSLLRIAQRDAVLSNACPFTADPVACGNVYYRILTKGLYATTQTFSGMVIELLENRGRANGSFAIAKVREVDCPLVSEAHWRARNPAMHGPLCPRRVSEPPPPPVAPLDTEPSIWHTCTFSCFPFVKVL